MPQFDVNKLRRPHAPNALPHAALPPPPSPFFGRNACNSFLRPDYSRLFSAIRVGIIQQFARPSVVQGGSSTTANLCHRSAAAPNRFELKRLRNKEVIMASPQAVADRGKLGGWGAIERQQLGNPGTQVQTGCLRNREQGLGKSQAHLWLLAKRSQRCFVF